MEAKNVQVWECGVENASDVIATLNNHTLTIEGKGKMIGGRWIEYWDEDAGEMSSYLKNLPWYGESITQIVIEKGITNIGAYAFHDCYGLTFVIIPNSVTTIDNCAFDNCTALDSITIPSNVTTIGNSAFANCALLVSVIIPDSVTSIDYHAFSDCTSLASVVIPNSVKTIGDGVFSGCCSLASIIIPDSIIGIGNDIFGGCYALESITNLNPAPQHISEKTFIEAFRKTVTLYVPAASVSAYNNAPSWTTFRTIAPILEKQSDIEFTSEQLEEEILCIVKEISSLKEKLRMKEDERETLRVKKLCMRGLEGNPKDVAAFMSLFNQRDGLKYLTHDFDETGSFDAEAFLAKTRKVFSEHLEELDIPQTLRDLLQKFAFENNPQWTGFDKEYKPKEITSGWSASDWQKSKNSGLHPIKQPQLAEVIKDFKRSTRIESPNLETLIDKVFDDETFEIEKRDLSKADFYTHVGQFSSALKTIFEEIQQRGDTDEKKKVSVEYKKAGACDDFFIRNVVITHHESYPTRDDEDLIKDWLALEKGNMGKIAELLKGYCHWSVITKIGEKPVKVNILREKGTLEQEEIDASEVKGFTHILTFYYQ